MCSSDLTKSLPGRDFMVTLGAYPPRMVGYYLEAGTFMHELGHALGLKHGGSDDVCDKPNYLSVMNYLFEETGIHTTQGSRVDFSRFALSTDESSLSKQSGLTQDPALATYSTFFAYEGHWLILPSLTAAPVDWDQNGQLYGVVSTDINSDRQVSVLKEIGRAHV